MLGSNLMNWSVEDTMINHHNKAIAVLAEVKAKRESMTRVEVKVVDNKTYMEKWK